MLKCVSMCSVKQWVFNVKQRQVNRVISLKKKKILSFNVNKTCQPIQPFV